MKTGEVLSVKWFKLLGDIKCTHRSYVLKDNALDSMISTDFQRKVKHYIN